MKKSCADGRVFKIFLSDLNMCAKKRDLYSANGQPVQGVTTIIGKLDKPALVGWAAKEASLYVARYWESGKAYPSDYIEAVLQNAKAAHRVKKEKAGDIGTDIHALCEAYCGNQLNPEDVPEEPSDLGEEKGYRRKALVNFSKLTAGWIWLAAEIVVIYIPEPDENGKINYDLAYGGTADGLAFILTAPLPPFGQMPEGMVILSDTKTSSGVYATHGLQCGFYSFARPQVDKEIVINGFKTTLWALWAKIEEARILHFDKELCAWEILERDVKQHYPYIPGICLAAAWVKKFDRPQWENSAVPAAIPSWVNEKREPATSIRS